MDALEDKVKNMKVEDLLKKHTDSAQADRKSVDRAMTDPKAKTNGHALHDKKNAEDNKERSRSSRKEKNKRKHAKKDRSVG